jgi:uncharacterized membrane protein YeiB
MQESEQDYRRIRNFKIKAGILIGLVAVILLVFVWFLEANGTINGNVASAGAVSIIIIATLSMLLANVEAKKRYRVNFGDSDER